MAEDTEGIALIEEYFKGVDDGFLIDVGAHDGVEKGSMTRCLMERGWAGLLIEPLPEAFEKLEKAYKGNPKATCLQMACSNRNGMEELYPCKGVSTLNKDWADACDAWWKHVKYSTIIQVQVRTLTIILREILTPPKVDLLQIDTEGHDFKVLQGMDFDRWHPKLICVETLDMVHRERKIAGKWQPNPEMHSFLKRRGYKLLHLSPGGNGFYARSES